MVTSQCGGHRAATVASPSGGLSVRLPGTISFMAKRKLQKLSSKRGLIRSRRMRRLGDDQGAGVIIRRRAWRAGMARQDQPGTIAHPLPAGKRARLRRHGSLIQINRREEHASCRRDRWMAQCRSTIGSFGSQIERRA